MRCGMCVVLYNGASVRDGRKVIVGRGLRVKGFRGTIIENRVMRPRVRICNDKNAVRHSLTCHA